jgi:hypothetical protein
LTDNEDVPEDPGEPPADANPESPSEVLDDSGRKVPERLVPIFETDSQFRRAVTAANRAARAMQHVEQTLAYQKLQSESSNRRDHRVYSSFFSTAARTVAAMRPANLCPECGGAYEPSLDNDPCNSCDGKGFLTADEQE